MTRTDQLNHLQNLSKQAADVALHFYKSEIKFGGNIEFAWSTAAMHLLSDAQEVAERDPKLANDFINMSKILLDDIRRINHSDDHRREPALVELTENIKKALANEN